MIRAQCFQCQGLSLIPGQVTKSLKAMQHSQKRKNSIFLKNFYLFIFGCAGSSLLLVGFSLVVESGVYSQLTLYRLLIAVVSLVTDHGL